MSLIAAQDLTKTYATDSVEVKAVQAVSLDIKAGSFLGFVGPSGSGKTTLLNLIGCLDKPSSGSLNVAGVDVVATRSTTAPRISRRQISALFFRALT